MSEICVGENIRRFRKAHGLSQQRLAMISGVARRTIAKYELDPGCNMETARLERIAQALDIGMVDLFRCPGDGQDTPQSKSKLVKRAMGISGAILLIVAIVALNRAQATPEATLVTIDPGVSTWQTQNPAPPTITAPPGQQTPGQPDPGEPETSVGAPAGADPDAAEPSFHRSEIPVADPPAVSSPAVSPALSFPAASPAADTYQPEEQPARARETSAPAAPEPSLEQAGKSGKVPPGQLKKQS